MSARTKTGSTAALAAVVLALGAAICAAEQTAGLTIVSFGDYLWLRVDGKAVALEPGTAAYEIPVGARASVAQGAATLLVSDTMVRVDAGDDFTTTSAEGQVRLLVNAGTIEVSAPGRPPTLVEAGRFLPVTGPQAGLLSGAAPAAVDEPPPAQPSLAAPTVPGPQPSSQVQAAPRGETADGAEWDPLGALASGISKMSSLGSPDLRLILELHPFYRLTETYDSNIYKVPKDKPDGRRSGGGVVSSWITTNELGTGWKLPFSKRSAMSGRYSAKASNYSSQSKTNNAVDQLVEVGLDHSGQRNWTLNLSESYQNTEDPAFSELVARQRHTSLQTSASLAFEQGRRFVFRLQGKHTLNKYLDPTLASSLNSYEASFGGEAGIKVAPKTKTYLAYAREITHYSAGRRDHSHSDRFGLGLEGQIGPRVKGRIQADAHRRRYENPPAGSPTAVSNFLTSVELNVKVARRTDGRVRLFRAINQTTFASNRDYLATGVALGLSHVWHKLVLHGDGSFETDRYPERTVKGSISRNRRDDIYAYGARVEYKIRPWLSTDMGFQLLQRFSAFPDDFDYSVTRTSVGLNIQF